MFAHACVRAHAAYCAGLTLHPLRGAGFWGVAGGRDVAEAVVRILKANPRNGLVQERAAHALHTLVRDDAANQVVAGASGAVKELVGAMRRHAESEELHAACAEALQNIVFQQPENQELARTAHAVDVVLLAMRKHPDSATVHEYACGALWNLIADHAENLAAARSGRAEALVLAGIERFPGHEGVQDNACGALSRLRLAGAEASASARALAWGAEGWPVAISPFHRYKPTRKGFCTWAAPPLLATAGSGSAAGSVARRPQPGPAVRGTRLLSRLLRR